jgi:hypothetical protein
MTNQFLAFTDLIYAFPIGIILLLCVPFINANAGNRLTFSLFGS